MSGHPSIALVITTRNRKEDLRRSLTSAAAQDYPYLEIRVYDDASQDGTLPMIREEFPQVIIGESKKRIGLVCLRNRGYQESAADWILSIDDDAYFTHSKTVSRIAEQLSANWAAALALPYLEVYPDGRIVTNCKIASGGRVRSFIGTAHVCHRKTFLELGGYHEFLVHQGEERDYCIRLFAAGKAVRVAEAPSLVHCVSPNRDLGRMHRWGTRNLMLHDYFYTPGWAAPVVMLRHAVKAILYRFSPGRACSTIRWLLGALPDFWRFRKHRRPLSAEEFREYYSLPGHGPSFVKAGELPVPCGVPVER